MGIPVSPLSMWCVFHGPANMTSVILLSPEVTLDEQQVRVEAIIPSPAPCLWITGIPKAEAPYDVQPWKVSTGLIDDLGNGPSRVTVVPGSIRIANWHGHDRAVRQNGDPRVLDRVAGKFQWRYEPHVEDRDTGCERNSLDVEVADRSRLLQPSTTAFGVRADRSEARGIHGRHARVDGAALLWGDSRRPAYRPARSALSCESVGRGKLTPKRSAQMWPAPISSPSAASLSA